MTLTGRSVFVVWALLGVGAMTILISGRKTLFEFTGGLHLAFAVLSEAYSSRYKNVLSKGSLERAVRNSRGRYATSPSSPSAPGTHTRLHSRSVSPDFSPGRRFTRDAKRNLETLPADLLSHAKTFHEHIYYFLNSTDMKEAPPPTLQKLLDEIADGERMDARLKQEILGDDSSRKVFLSSSPISICVNSFSRRHCSWWAMKVLYTCSSLLVRDLHGIPLRCVTENDWHCRESRRVARTSGPHRQQ